MPNSVIRRREFLKGLGAGAASVSLASLLAPRLRGDEPKSAARPNIIVMLVDDMGYSDLGCYGSEIQTPNLDALALNGIRFTNGHCTGRCWPSRGAILTGLYPHQAGYEKVSVSAEEIARRRAGNLYIPEALNPAGYATCMSGKWHLDGKGTDRGFKRVDFQFAGQGGGSGGAGSYWHESFGPTRYVTDHIAAQAVKYVDEFGRKKQPFFIYWTPTAPHWPLHAFTSDLAKYKGKYDAGPKAIAEARYKRMLQLGIAEARWPWKPPPYLEVDEVPKHGDKKPRDYRADVCTELDVNTAPAKDFKWCHWKSKGYGNKRKAASFEEMMEIFSAQIDRLDQNVGKVVAKLKEVGVFDDTLFIFCSDNGASREGMGDGPAWAGASNTPFKLWKKDSYEGGVGTSFIMHWPARLAANLRGGINRTWCHVIDVLPTVLDAAGAQHPGKDPRGQPAPPPEGRSLLGALEGKLVPLAKPIFIDHSGNRAVITEQWKLVAESGDPWSLYDMDKDRFEQNDLAAEQPEKVKEMAAQWDAWADRVGAIKHPEEGARRGGNKAPEEQ